MQLSERIKYVEGFKNIKELLTKLMIVIIIQLCITPYITLNNQNTTPFIIYNYMIIMFGLGYINHIKLEIDYYINMLLDIKEI
jgi:hypothetical protein